MGKIRELADRILVMYEPDEIISERIGFKENTVAMLGSAIAFCAREKLKGTRLGNIQTDATKVEFKDGCFVVTLLKLRGANEKQEDCQNNAAERILHFL